MTDNAERWRNVAQAAQWLAEGREVEYRNKPGQGFATEWAPVTFNGLPEHLWVFNEYRLKPEPPKPREFKIGWRGDGFRGSWEVMAGPEVTRDDLGKVICSREVIE